jgi:AcrR family transcriptional regulator
MHTQSTDVKGKKAQQGAATRQALLNAACALFGERGYTATSIDDVAQAANVTKGAFYHHYDGKQELFAGVYEQVKREVSERVAAAFLEPDPWVDLCAGCQAMLDAHLDPRVQRIVLQDAQAVLDADTIRRVDAHYGAVVLRGALRRAIRAGVVRRTLPLKILALMLTGAILEGCMAIADSDDPTQARADAGDVLTTILQGLRPPTP